MIQDRRYKQLSSEYEALRSQPRISYSEYEARFAEVCVFFTYYSIDFLYQTLGKTQLTRTGILFLNPISVLTDLFL